MKTSKIIITAFLMLLTTLTLNAQNCAEEGGLSVTHTTVAYDICIGEKIPWPAEADTFEITISGVTGTYPDPFCGSCAEVNGTFTFNRSNAGTTTFGGTVANTDASVSYASGSDKWFVRLDCVFSDLAQWYAPGNGTNSPPTTGWIRNTHGDCDGGAVSISYSSTTDCPELDITTIDGLGTDGEPVEYDVTTWWTYADGSTFDCNTIFFTPGDYVITAYARGIPDAFSCPMTAIVEVMTVNLSVTGINKAKILEINQCGTSKQYSLTGVTNLATFYTDNGSIYIQIPTGGEVEEFTWYVEDNETNEFIASGNFNATVPQRTIASNNRDLKITITDCIMDFTFIVKQSSTALWTNGIIKEKRKLDPQQKYIEGGLYTSRPLEQLCIESTWKFFFYDASNPQSPKAKSIRWQLEGEEFGWIQGGSGVMPQIAFWLAQTKYTLTFYDDCNENDELDDDEKSKSFEIQPKGRFPQQLTFCLSPLTVAATNFDLDGEILKANTALLKRTGEEDFRAIALIWKSGQVDLDQLPNGATRENIELDYDPDYGYLDTYGDLQAWIVARSETVIIVNEIKVWIQGEPNFATLSGITDHEYDPGNPRIFMKRSQKPWKTLVHELGHRVGIDYESTDSDYIMYGSNNTNNGKFLTNEEARLYEK